MSNVLSPDKIAALLKRPEPSSSVVGRDDEDTGGGSATVVETSPGLTWCEFCKGHYNEYHFGEPEGGDI